MKKITLASVTIFLFNFPVFAQPGELLSSKAKIEFEKQHFNQCIEEMSELINREPKNDAALVERARCLYLSADDTNDEKVILAEILKTMVDKDKANSAVMLEVMSRRKKAIADAGTAIGINPGNAAAYNIRGLVKSTLGTADRQASIADFDKAIEIDPTFIKPYFNRGITKADMSDYTGAVTDFTKVLELDPTNIAARDNLSRYSIYSTLTVTSGCVSGNCVNGKGKFNINGGDIYEGEFVNSVKQGQGIYTFKNGVVYTGQFANNEFNGVGKIKYTNGEIYEGDFVNSKRQGWGKNIFYNGDVYEGYYVNDDREGQGIYTYKNEDAYAGEWKNNFQHGDGKFYSKAANEVQDGIWKDGVLISKTNQSITDPWEAIQNAPAKETAILLQETLNGKFDYIESKPLMYILTMRQSGETFRYQIEFLNDNKKLSFRWKETTKQEQSEKLFITPNAITSANKYVNFFNTKAASLTDQEIAFILSQTLYKELKEKKEIKIDLGNGMQLMSYNYSLTAPIGSYTNKNIKELLYHSDDGKTKMQILDDPICPLILQIETPEYTLKLVKS